MQESSKHCRIEAAGAGWAGLEQEAALCFPCASSTSCHGGVREMPLALLWGRAPWQGLLCWKGPGELSTFCFQQLLLPWLCSAKTQHSCPVRLWGGGRAHLASRAQEEEQHREGHEGPGSSRYREGHVRPGGSRHMEGHVVGLGSSRPALSSRQEPTGLAKGGKGAAAQPISHLCGHVNGSDWGF